MWQVSPRFLASIGQPHRNTSRVTFVDGAGRATLLSLVAGAVACNDAQGIRRTANLTVKGGDELFGAVTTPGGRFAVEHGISWGSNQEELVPVITGELATASKDGGDNVISLKIADDWQRVAAAKYVTAYTPPVGARRVDLIAAAVTDAKPDVTVVNQSSDTSIVVTAQSWSGRTDLIASLTKDGGTDAFFLPDGRFLIRDSPSITDQFVWLIKGGMGGSLTSTSRERPLDKLYNTVVVTPAGLDGTQTWDQVTRSITDTANPRHPNRIGPRPYLWQSPTVITADQAGTVADILLAKVQGTTETLSLGLLSNPALEGGDVLRIVNRIDAGKEIITHFNDGHTLDLLTGGTTLNTRSYTDLDQS